jgi:hypothetical protein
MNPCRGIAASLALTCTAPWVAAQPVPPPPQLATLPAANAVAAPARAASAPAAAASAGAGNVRVTEDDQVRIEEVRDARGRLQRVTVHSKVGGKSYEIIVPAGGKDSSQHRGTSGQAAWSLLDF